MHWPTVLPVSNLLCFRSLICLVLFSPSCGELVKQKIPALLMVGLKLYKEYVHVNVEMKLFILMVTDLLTQALTESPNNFLPRPGICGIIRPEPRAFQQQSNQNGTILLFSNI